VVSEPTKPNEGQEAKLRALVGRTAAYAESGPTFDPKGRYLCGECAARSGRDGCSVVSGVISFTTGSCRLWTRDRLEPASKLSQGEAQYAERPEAKGFGCWPRCEHGQTARRPDGEGRRIWCQFWGMHVMKLACCSEENGPDLIEPEKDEE
jgi:hypothetical protein